MKRILSILLTLCIIASCFTFSVMNVAAADETEEVVVVAPQVQKAFDFLSNLGIMVGDDKGNANLEKNMTRAEFAQLIKNILTFANANGADEESGSSFDESIWNDSFFGSDDNSDQLITDTGSSSGEVAGTVEVTEFEDVPTAHWAYDAIYYVRDLGIMNGRSATVFDPDGEVKTNEVIKTVMVMLGYKQLAEANGGYPTGYLKFAQKENLTYGAPAGEICTRGAIAVILKNAMDSKILMEASYGENGDISFTYDEKRTFATDILGLNKIDGIMTDNGYTAILGDSEYEGAEIVVNNTKFRVPEGKAFSQFIGRDVTCWFTNYKSNDSGLVMYVETNGRDKVTEIDIEALTGANDEEFTYKVNKSSKAISYEGAYIIHNGVSVASYDKTLFTNLVANQAYGKISVIETRSDLYKKIIVIDEFETWVVGNVNTEEGKVYNVLRDSEYVETDDIIELDFDDPKYIITIYKADGTPGSFNDIQKNSVLDIVRNGNVFVIYVTNKTVSEFTIQSVIENKGKTYITDGETEYEVTPALMNYDLREEFALNKTFTLSLNSQGRVAWAVAQGKAGLQVGYIVEIGTRGSSFTSRDYGIQVYTIGGMHTLFDIAENVRVSDHNGVESKMTEKQFYDAYGSEYNAATNILDGFFRYTVNEEDEINYIELPILDPNTKINGKMHLVVTNDSNEIETGTAGYYRNNSLGGIVAAPSTAKVIKVDSTFRHVDDEKAFGVGAMSSVPTRSSDDGDKMYKIRAYSDVEGALAIQYAVIDIPSGATGMNTQSATPYVYIVSEVAGGRFPDDTLGTVIKAKSFKNGSISDVNLYIKDDAVFDTEGETNVRVSTADTSLGWVKIPFEGEIEPGDIIRVTKDENGLVDHVRVVFDENGVDGTGNPQTPGVIPGVSRTCTASASHPKYNTNPFAYGGGTNQNLSSGKGFNTGSFRFFQSYPLKIRDGAIKLTAWDVIQNGYPEGGVHEDYKEEVWSTSKIVVVDFKDGDITIRTGTMSDIKTFEDFGADCSRVMFNSRFANTPCMIVYNSFSWED